MDYFNRYLNGEHELVWAELQTLGAAVRQPPYFVQARQVADETMRRVGRNCERIVERLRAAGYQFGVYPDGSRGYYTEGPLVAHDREAAQDLKFLEENAGPLPISLVSFWEQVGSVDLVGRLPGWPTGLDPLVVNPPAGPISDLDDRDDMLEQRGHFEGSLAPDDLHKDNVSGGDPYAVAMPDPSMDSPFLNERHGLYFVPYLRLAILRFGGFPGIEGREPELPILHDLLSGMEPF